MNSPDIILWVGLPNSGRRELLRDVSHAFRESGESSVFLFHDQEPPDPKADEALASGRDFTILPYGWDGSAFSLPDPFPENPDRIFWCLAGLANPLDQFEAIKSWLEARAWPLTRIVTVLSARLLSEHHELNAYYEACIHFSDVVLLNQREGLPPDWGSKFIQHYEKERFPCLFEQVKHNRVRNPALVLDSLPRRMSQFFDSLEELAHESTLGTEWEFEEEFDDDLSEDEEDAIPEDHYLRRNLGGDRKFRIPDLSKILNP